MHEGPCSRGDIPPSLWEAYCKWGYNPAFIQGLHPSRCPLLPPSPCCQPPPTISFSLCYLGQEHPCACIPVPASLGACIPVPASLVPASLCQHSWCLYSCTSIPVPASPCLHPSPSIPVPVFLTNLWPCQDHAVPPGAPVIPRAAPGVVLRALAVLGSRQCCLGRSPGFLQR